MAVTMADPATRPSLGNNSPVASGRPALRTAAEFASGIGTPALPEEVNQQVQGCLMKRHVFQCRASVSQYGLLPPFVLPHLFGEGQEWERIENSPVGQKGSTA